MGTANLDGKEAGGRCRGWQPGVGVGKSYTETLDLYYPGSAVNTGGTLYG